METSRRSTAWIAALAGICAVLLALELTGVREQLGSSLSGTDEDAAASPARTSSPGSRDTLNETRRTTAVRELLSERAEAVRARDRSAFMATVDPGADPAFIRAQREMFGNLTDVPLREWWYRVDHAGRTDVSTLADDYPEAERLWAPEASLVYALAGADERPTDLALGYLFARRSGQWYLTSDTALEELGSKTDRAPWHFGPCVVLRTGSGLVLAHPGRVDVARRLSAELDAAVEAVTEMWGERWSQRVVVWLPDTMREMRAIVGPDLPAKELVAVAIADRVNRERRTAEGQRIVFTPERAEQLSPLSLRVILRHEITHVATRTVTAREAPQWLVEGFAEYTGFHGVDVPLAHAAPELAASVRADGPPAELPSNTAFVEPDAQLGLAYQRSWSLCRYIAERFGESELLTLYRRMAGTNEDNKAEINATLRDVLGVDRAAIVEGWGRYLNRILR